MVPHPGWGRARGRRWRPRSWLPWRRPRFELLLLLLVAAAALAPVNSTSIQDVSRLCLTRSLVHGHLNVDNCVGTIVDRSSYGGHLYTNKAPGMSVLELPAAEALRLPAPSRWAPDGDAKLYVIRLLSSGLGFLLCAFLVGRITEGIAPGLGGFALVVFALGTLTATLAVENFDHVPTAALGFAAFVLAGNRRPLAAGLAAGAALTVEYQALPLLVVVGAYVGARGLRPVGRYALGTLPGILLLGAYDWAAFGAPWHDPLRYADNGFRPLSRSGVLGVHLPTAHGARLVFLGDRGLLLASPIVVAAFVGLWLLWREGYQAEAGVCLAVTVIYTLAECGYFDPNGGLSPGPRYLVPALPFLALGLGPIFDRLPRLTTVLAAGSMIATLAVTLTWASGTRYSGTIWHQLIPFPGKLGANKLAPYFPKTVYTWLGVGAQGAALIVAAAGLAALAVALVDTRR